MSLLKSKFLIEEDPLAKREAFMVSLRNAKRKEVVDQRRKRNYAALSKNKVFIDPCLSKAKSN